MNSLSVTGAGLVIECGLSEPPDVDSDRVGSEWFICKWAELKKILTVLCPCLGAPSSVIPSGKLPRENRHDRHTQGTILARALA